VKPLTRKQVSEITGLSVKTIDRAIQKGDLETRKYDRAVRITAESFQRWQLRAAAKGSTTPGNTHVSTSGVLCRFDRKVGS
jgi:predicted DNA-binding transcriptional regulator AlpA